MVLVENKSSVLNSLHTIGIFQAEDLLLFSNKIKTRTISKDEVLLKQDEICQSAYFVLKGAFLQYNIKDEIEQNIIDLHIENEWFLNQQSFVAQKPSENFIVAFTDSVVLELTIHSLHELIAHSPSFFQLGKILEPTNARIHFFDNSLNPLQKYEYLIQNKRELLQAFPLKIIASYLKITPETLSRVREKLAKGTTKSIS